MENPTPFDLNQAIQQWRERISSAPAFRDRDVDELEDHLRDATSSLMLRGLSTQESLWIAQHRLGSDSLLTGEFNKTNQAQVWLDRALWMVVGAFSMGTLSSITHLAIRAADFGVFQLTGQFGLGPLTLVLHPLTLGLAIFLAYRWVSQSGFGSSRMRSWICTHPIASVFGIFALWIACLAVARGISIATMRNLPLDYLHSTTKWQTFTAMITGLITPGILAWLLIRARRPFVTASNS